MTSSLARFFRLGISRGEETISVRTEIEYVETYLAIQKQRYKDKLSYEIAFAPELTSPRSSSFSSSPSWRTPSTTASRTRKGPGSSGSRASATGSRWSSASATTAWAWPRDQLAALRDGLIEPRPSNGVGVRNVQERIHVYFGPEYGVSFESTPGRARWQRSASR